MNTQQDGGVNLPAAEVVTEENNALQNDDGIVVDNGGALVNEAKKSEEAEAAAKAAAEVASQTTTPVETQPVPGMVLYKGAPIHVTTPLPDEPDMFAHIIDLVKFAGDSFLANIKTAMRLYTGGMASEINNEAICKLLDGVASRAEEIVDDRMKEMENRE